MGVAPPLPRRAPFLAPRAKLPYPLEEPNCRLFARARHGLWQGVKALGLGENDEVLAPAYHCGSEIEALVCAGLHCRFYDCLPDLSPDEEHLESLLGPKVRALYLIHYLGRPQDLPRWRRWCDEHDLLLFEDAAQAWMATSDGRPVGAYGDLAIFGLHKTLGLPDGGALISRVAAPEPKGESTPGLVPALQAGRKPPQSFRVPEQPAQSFALGDPQTPPTRASRQLLVRLANPDVAGRRRCNHLYVARRLAHALPAALRTLPSGAAPLAFLVVARDKPALLEHLERQGVFGGRLWDSSHPALGPEGHPGADYARARLVGLPVHQQLSDDELERICEAVESCPPGILEDG
jgi:dTDP-4-amino-4,6-dideoxygalactose transaminase